MSCLLCHICELVSHPDAWQFDKSKPSLIYLLYRTLLAAFLIATWCVSLSIASFSIYFTNWGYTMCVLQGVLAFLMAFFAYLFVVLDKPKALQFILKLHPIYWVIHVAATSAGFVITVIFWSVLYTSDMGFTALNFYVHGSNSIVLLIDLLIIGHPVRLLHFIYPLLFGLAYIIFSVAYYFYDTNRGGVGYVYAILDWSKPLMAFSLL
ncbi:hypothetical protein NQ317_006908 [Molorchus minor]|uniref:Uncharacterized protein n=1 Tax=Molorchus minor TaxID=1323400 RepID=A0ABQ9J5T5_9CUCU|nr:hypothetical protein NQ317_006908 [Molorchus minor]